MLDLGWTELLVLGVVALIVIGPKDLPMLFRKVGKFVGKARSMAREFSRAMDDAADEAGVNEVGKTLKSVSNPLKASMDQVKKATSEFASYDPASDTGKLAAGRLDAAKKVKEAAEQRAAEQRNLAKKPSVKVGKKQVQSAKKPPDKKQVASKNIVSGKKQQGPDAP